MNTPVKKFAKLASIICRRRYLSALWSHHVAAAIEHTRVLKNIGTVCTVVDIGANVGQFSLVARQSFPGSRIVAFEPLPSPAARYRQVFAGDECATLHEVAIGPQAGEATIHISHREDSSSLLPITAAQERVFPGTSQAATRAIGVARLADYLARHEIISPALLKLDVQGFELEALQGSEDLLQEFAWIYCECSFIELYEDQALASTVIAWLYKRGFTLSGVYNMSCDSDGRAVQADFLFRITGT